MIDFIWPIFGCFPIDHHRRHETSQSSSPKSPAAVLSSSGLNGFTTELSSMTNPLSMVGATLWLCQNSY